MESSKSNNGGWEEKDMINTILVYEEGYDVYEEGYDIYNYHDTMEPICIVRTKDAKIFELIMERFRADKKQRETDGSRNSTIEVTVAELKEFIDDAERCGVKGFEYMMWKIDSEEEV